MSTETPDIETQLRTLFDVQASGPVEDIAFDDVNVADVVSLDAARAKRRRWPVAVTAIATAAAVVAGVVVVRSNESEPQGVVATSWGYPIEAEPGVLQQYELAATPDGYTYNEPVTSGICTSWTVAEGAVACSQISGQTTVMYTRGDDTAISVTTLVDADGRFDELLAPLLEEGTPTLVNGKAAVIVTDEGAPELLSFSNMDIQGDFKQLTLMWSESESVAISVLYVGAADGAPSEDQFVALAESVRPFDPTDVRLALELRQTTVSLDDGSSFIDIIGVGGSSDEPCIMVSTMGAPCTPLTAAAGEPYALLADEYRFLPSYGIAAVGAVDPSIASVRVEGVGGEPVTTETAALPGQHRRFFVAPASETFLPQLLVFLDADSNEVARYTFPENTATATGTSPQGSWALTVDAPDGVESRAVLETNPIGGTTATAEWSSIDNPIDDTEPLFLLEAGGPILGVTIDRVTRVEYEGRSLELEHSTGAAATNAFVVTDDPDEDGGSSGRLTGYDAAGAVVFDVEVRFDSDQFLEYEPATP